MRLCADLLNVQQVSSPEGRQKCETGMKRLPKAKKQKKVKEQ